MAKPLVGAQLYSLREFCKTASDLAATLKKVRAIGYTTVQVSGIGPIDPKDVAQAAQDAGVTICCTHMGWNAFREELDKTIETHKIYNCKHPAIGSLPREYVSVDGVKRFRDELIPIAEKLAANGMDFSYHNHDWELVRFGDQTWLEMIYAQIEPKYLKAEIDTHWIQAGGGDPAAYIRKCAGREPLLHLKDFVIVPPRDRHFAPVGSGNMNFPAILKAAEESGVEFAMVEQDDCYGADPFECMAQSYRYLSAMGWK